MSGAREPPLPRRPTIREVAGLAGVSIATVSNVVNGNGGVRAGTRERVEDAIRRLGYSPDQVARTLIGRRARPAALDPEPEPARLTAVGYISADYTARLDVLPHRDDRVTARGIDKTLGGPAANVAVMAASLGEPWPLRVELVTALGDDGDSAWAVETLRARGVEPVGGVGAAGRRLSRCIVMVEANGSRTIVNEPVAIGEAELLAHLERVGRPAGPHGLHLDGYQVARLATAVAAANRQGLTTSVHTTGLHPEWRTLAGLTRLRELFRLVFLNREVARDITGFRGALPELVRRVEALVRATVPATDGTLVLLTLGVDGAVLFAGDDGPPVPVPAPVVDPVDATGAGDCLAGVFLAAWLNGLPAREALGYAVVAASRSVTAAGAQERRLRGFELVALAADDLRSGAGLPNAPRPRTLAESPA